MTTLAFHASRIITDLGVLLVLASMSLAFVTAPSGNRSAMDLDALPTLMLVAPVFLLTLIPKHTRPLPRPIAWACLVLGLAAFPYSFAKYLDAVVLADTLGGGIGLGVRLHVFGAFVVIVGVGVGLTRLFRGLPSAGSPRPATEQPEPRRQPPARGQHDPAPRPGPAPAPAPRPRPARAAVEHNPFNDPLFDSLEIPETRVEPLRQPGLVYDPEGGVGRYADDYPDDDPGEPTPPTTRR